MKKEKVITLRMNNDSFDIIREFAEARGITVNAYLNSVADAQAEWFIPFNSYEHVAVPKKLLSRLFESANNDELERMAQEWANEGKNAVLLSWGDFTLESAIDLDRRVAKYLIGSDIKVTILNYGRVPFVRSTYTNMNNNMEDAEEKTMADNDILMVLRHDLGNNFSVFWARSGFHYYSLLESRKVSVSFDSTTVSIKLEKLR
jgi:predicted DNA-binding ribbon-helix-helix protein